MSDFNKKYKENIDTVRKKLRMGESFDIIEKRLKIGEKEATFFCVDGFLKDEMLEKLFEFLSKISAEELKQINDADSFAEKYITYIEAGTEESLEKFITLILSGAVGMIADGFTKSIIIDSRRY